MKVHHVSTSLPKCISPKFGKPCTVAVGNAELASCMKGRAFSKSADSRNGLCPFIRCRYLCLVSILSGLLCHRASASFSSLNLRPALGQKASSRSAEKRGRERERERRYWRTPQLGMTRRQGKYLAIPKWNRRVALCNLASSKCQKKGCCFSTWLWLRLHRCQLHRGNGRSVSGCSGVHDCYSRACM